VSGEFPKGPVEFSRSCRDYLSPYRRSITLFRNICWDSVSLVFSPVHCGVNLFGDYFSRAVNQSINQSKSEFI